MDKISSKKGVSELVSYVLLVIIAIGLGVIVYNYLRSYVPNDTKPTCDIEVDLVLQDAWCNLGVDNEPTKVGVEVMNKGLFKIDAVYIRLAPGDKKTFRLINGNNLTFSKFVMDESAGLMPGKSAIKEERVSSDLVPSAGEYTVKVEPAVFIKNYLTLCPDATITQKVQCT
jgi:hypothetical protein